MKEDAKKLAMKTLRALGKADLIYAHHGEVYARDEAYEKLAALIEEAGERGAERERNKVHESEGKGPYIVVHKLFLKQWQERAEKAEQSSKQTVASIVKFLRTTPRAMGMLISVASSQDIARLAAEIEARTWPAEDET